MKKFLLILISSILLFGFAASSAAFYMDFEEGLGSDGAPIVGVPGVTFTVSEGEYWMYGDITTGSYNVTSVDLGVSYGTGRYNMYGDVFAWLGTTGNWGRIDFDDTNGTWFQVGVCSAFPFDVTAYDEFDNALDVASLPSANTQWEGYTDMTFLRVDAPVGSTIAYVILSDSGNYWALDNMTGDMAGGTSVPEPASMLLLGIGLIGLAGLRRKE